MSKIDQTFAAYRFACDAARNESETPEARDKATDDAIALRQTLDAELIAASHEAEIASARSAMDPIVRPTGGGAPTVVDPELRAFLTPGSPVKDYWVRPAREQVMGPASKFKTRLASPYLTTDTATVGSAYFFTPDLYQKVVTGMIDSSGVLEAEPTLIVTNHLRPIQVPVLTQDAVATAGVEGSPATATNTEGDAVTLGAFRYDGSFAVSLETILASEYDLNSLLSTFAIRATSNAVAAQLAMGVGGGAAPQGVFDASAVTVGKTCALATAATTDEVLGLATALSKGYRKAARMVVSDALYTQMLAWKNADGDYLLRSIEGGGESFIGKPVYSEPQADQGGVSAGEVHAVYGDFSGLFVRLCPMFFRRTDADPLNPVFTFAVWVDAQIADQNSLVSLKMHA